MTKLDEAADDLAATTKFWSYTLISLDAATVQSRPAADRWSVSDVIGHLVDSPCNNHQRFVRAQNCTELVFPKYEQNEWVAAGHYRTCPWGSLVQL